MQRTIHKALRSTRWLKLRCYRFRNEEVTVNNFEIPLVRHFMFSAIYFCSSIRSRRRISLVIHGPPIKCAATYFVWFHLTMSLDNSLRTIPCFPPYPGPYKVGTAEYEIPISDLSSSSSAPETDSPISTVSFRVFYPADDPKKPPPAVYWIPDPQREFVAAYARFLGANRTFSTIASYVHSGCCCWGKALRYMPPVMGFLAVENSNNGNQMTI